MKIYRVGGSVRDALLGLPVRDHDWVVVGATPEALAAEGYLPVGKDFPVFLHPKTREEYALARTERKTAQGYHGFAVHAAPDVTLEDDLARRDLTINAIAQDADGVLTDPYGGQRDIAARVLRHVTSAFAEDPVRILRVARFAARFTDFNVAPETMQLMRDMVVGGEVDALVPERVWQELARGLMERQPSRMFEVLQDCSALRKLLPEVNADLPLMRVLDTAAQLNAPLPVRFACLARDLNPNLIKGLCQRLRVPTDCREITDVLAREHSHLHRSAEFEAAARVRLLERCDAFRKPQRFADILLACECDARGRLGLSEQPYPQRQRLLAALTAAQSVPTHAVAAAAEAQGESGAQIGERVHAARVAAVAAAQAHSAGPT
ncbi:MAG: tRNA nucleotidyltransferase (CCA-adding enzyme) [Litorivivens sp.]|jgi:tRNA nucleotidyltransferase (CCA-adding enzyme)